MKPIIGITASINIIDYETENQSVIMSPATYLDAVKKSGGVGIIISEGEYTEELLGILDGLIIAGGRDISPTLYGEENHEQTKDIEISQDEWEMLLIKGAIKRDLPLLCICRGHQLLCITRGGTLHQHLPETEGYENHGESNGKWSEHEVIFESNSQISNILGSKIMVNSGHHQGVCNPGDLTVVGRTNDGLIEALELESQTFLISTQWHPEMINQYTIFDSLINSARS